jgi:hypothetical protein
MGMSKCVSTHSIEANKQTGCVPEYIVNWQLLTDNC